MFDVILIIHIDTQYEQAKKTVERELNDLLLTYMYFKKKVDLLKKKRLSFEKLR